MRLGLMGLLLPAAALAQNPVYPGRFVVEPPTLINLGFEWEIRGDANRNATVQVRYRRAGAAAWQEAQPMLRLGGERVFRAREHLDYTVPDRFAGSILDLDPDTEYECEFRMSDPDGVVGEAVQRVRVRTRAEPRPAPNGRVLHVYPPDWKGERLQPAFTGLLEAYYGAGRGDWNVVRERKARPGDTILIHAGLYKANRLDYVDPLMTPFDGTYVLTLKGTPEAPITIRAAGDGEVIFDGDGCHRLFDVMATEYHIFEGLTIRNTDVAFFAGHKDVLGAKGLTIRRCRFEDVGIGVTTQYAGSRDFYIADNVFLGRDDRFRLIGWFDPGIYGAHPLRSYYAIKVYGPGHVICHNAIAYFHDGICISTYGTPEPEDDRRAVSIDIYNNDIHMVGDDFIETDGGVHNIRVLRNRGVNAAHGGLSAQPVFGGPVYFLRNLLYHVASGVSLKFAAKPAGLLVYHNTVISEHVIRDPHSNVHFRNNLFLGSDAPDRPTAVFANATAYSSYDYNGYRRNRNVRHPYVWLSPPSANERLYEPAPSHWRAFATLDELRAATGQERHGIEVDYDIFEDLRGPDGRQRHAVYHAVDLNFRLKPGSRAVDAGVRLANINDEFAGKAPDLGALEVGRPEPHYGPRTGLKQPFYR
ncbi:MAG: hypothetical protein RMK57_04455 [Bryobacterales bacterium]|nr:hypothetical protein [Bryobacterales bacterium]